MGGGGGAVLVGTFKASEYINTLSTTVSVPSSELGTPHPLSASECVPPRPPTPELKEGGTNSLAGD